MKSALSVVKAKDPPRGDQRRRRASGLPRTDAATRSLLPSGFIRKTAAPRRNAIVVLSGDHRGWEPAVGQDSSDPSSWIVHTIPVLARAKARRRGPGPASLDHEGVTASVAMAVALAGFEGSATQSSAPTVQASRAPSGDHAIS